MTDYIETSKMRGWRVCPACVAAVRACDATWCDECPRCEWGPLMTLGQIRRRPSRAEWDDINLPGFLRAIEAGRFPVMEVGSDDD